MTDGCGFINEAALTTIYKSGLVNLPHRPVAVQGRIGGAKVMWILHPNNESAEPKIWIRLSQKKVNLSTPLHRSHRIFELVAPARVATPCSLDAQFINNLAHNGISNEAFAHYTRESLKDTLKPLTSWDESHAMVPLASAIYLIGGTRGSCLQRMAPGKTRALGLARDFHREEQVEILTDQGPLVLDAAHIVSSGRCSFSGAPVSVHESAYEPLLAGFRPMESDFLYKMRQITKQAVESAVKEYRINVQQSLKAYVLPGTHADYFAYTD